MNIQNGSARSQIELDEIETEQIGRFQLHLGVKNGLDSLRREDLSIYVLTEMGRKAGMQFLSQHSISQYIDEVICRDDTKGVGELSKRLEIALDKLEILPEECIYFCNRLSDSESRKIRLIFKS